MQYEGKHYRQDYKHLNPEAKRAMFSWAPEVETPQELVPEREYEPRRLKRSEPDTTVQETARELASFVQHEDKKQVSRTPVSRQRDKDEVAKALIELYSASSFDNMPAEPLPELVPELDLEPAPKDTVTKDTVVLEPADFVEVFGDTTTSEPEQEPELTALELESEAEAESLIEESEPVIEALGVEPEPELKAQTAEPEKEFQPEPIDLSDLLETQEDKPVDGSAQADEQTEASKYTVVLEPADFVEVFGEPKPPEPEQEPELMASESELDVEALIEEHEPVIEALGVEPEPELKAQTADPEQELQPEPIDLSDLLETQEDKPVDVSTQADEQTEASKYTVVLEPADFVEVFGEPTISEPEQEPELTALKPESEAEATIIKPEAEALIEEPASEKESLLSELDLSDFLADLEAHAQVTPEEAIEYTIVEPLPQELIEESNAVVPALQDSEQELVSQEPELQDAGQQVPESQMQVPQELGTQDRELQELVSQEPELQDAGQQVPESQMQVPQELGTQDSELKELASREPELQAAESQVPDQHEPASQEPASQLSDQTWPELQVPDQPGPELQVSDQQEPEQKKSGTGYTFVQELVLELAHEEPDLDEYLPKPEPEEIVQDTAATADAGEKHAARKHREPLFEKPSEESWKKVRASEQAHTAKRRKRRPSRFALVILIAVEVMMTGASSFAVFNMSWDRITDRRTSYITEEIKEFDTKTLTGNMSKFVKKAREQVAEVVNEDVWTTDTVNYRVGPDESYDSPGSLSIYAGVKRTGLTYNDWSRVKIGDEEYYVLSEYLTTEAPIITATGQKGEYQKYALTMLPNYGWAETEMYPLIKLWDRESGWNPSSHNRSSGAHGIPQALPASKMASEGSDYYTNGNTQIRWGLNYIRGRYGSPSNAWAHFQSHGWY